MTVCVSTLKVILSFMVKLDSIKSDYGYENNGTEILVQFERDIVEENDNSKMESPLK